MENQYLFCTKEEVRAVIRFFNFQNISPTEIHRKITEVYGPQVMSRKSVSVWCTKFNSGRESVEDEARSGRPISTSTAETIDAVEKLLRSDRRLKIREMATQLDLPKTTVHEIVHEKLNFRKVCARWVPKMHDNATPHSAGKTKAWLEKYKWEVLEHPSYSPDLAPSDFFLFGPLKKHLGGTHFQNEEEVMNAVTEYFDGKCAAYFRDGIFKLLHRWEKCINLNGDYVEK